MKWILFYFYLEATGCAPFLAKSPANELNTGIDIAEKRSWIQCGQISQLVFVRQYKQHWQSPTMKVKNTLIRVFPAFGTSAGAGWAIGGAHFS